MAEPENARLASRLTSIASALAGNGHAGVATGLSDELITALAQGIAPYVKERVAESVTPLTAHITKLEQRLAELETRHVLEDCGVWEQDKSYRPGSVVQLHGSRWVCLAATTSRPPGEDWQLWVKRGRDGK